MMTLMEIEKEVKQLSREQQLNLVSDILKSDASESEISWYKEAERRRDELLSGKVQGIPASQALAEIKAELHRK
jgi:RNA polymerase-interacting CarD/CdnL/TRCF family regulator